MISDAKHSVNWRTARQAGRLWLHEIPNCNRNQIDAIFTWWRGERHDFPLYRSRSSAEPTQEKVFAGKRVTQFSKTLKFHLKRRQTKLPKTFITWIFTKTQKNDVFELYFAITFKFVYCCLFKGLRCFSEWHLQLWSGCMGIMESNDSFRSLQN